MPARHHGRSAPACLHPDRSVVGDRPMPALGADGRKFCLGGSDGVVSRRRHGLTSGGVEINNEENQGQRNARTLTTLLRGTELVGGTHVLRPAIVKRAINAGTSDSFGVSIGTARLLFEHLLDTPIRDEPDRGGQHVQGDRHGGHEKRRRNAEQIQHDGDRTFDVAPDRACEHRVRTVIAQQHAS